MSGLWTTVSLLLLPLYFFSYGQIKLPRLIGNGMVLQRDTKATLWACASPNEQITIAFHGEQYHTAAGSDGKWQLPPQHAGRLLRQQYSKKTVVILQLGIPLKDWDIR